MTSMGFYLVSQRPTHLCSLQMLSMTKLAFPLGECIAMTVSRDAAEIKRTAATKYGSEYIYTIIFILVHYPLSLYVHRFLPKIFRISDVNCETLMNNSITQQTKLKCIFILSFPTYYRYYRYYNPGSQYILLMLSVWFVHFVILAISTTPVKFEHICLIIACDTIFYLFSHGFSFLQFK